MLRREDSNKVLKGIKAVVFATGLTFLSSMNVEAQEMNQEEIVEEMNENNNQSSSVVLYTTVFSILAIGGISFGIYTNWYLKHLPSIELVGTKLNDENSKDDVQEAMKYLKITNK